MRGSVRESTTAADQQPACPAGAAMLPIPSLLDLLARLLHPGTPGGATSPDPVDHPAIRRMDMRELADLPLPKPTAGPWCPACDRRG